MKMHEVGDLNLSSVRGHPPPRRTLEQLQNGTLRQNGTLQRARVTKIYLALSKEKIMKLPLKNIVWKEGNFYVAQCLNVEVSSFGDTKEDALKNLQEALDLYFEDMPVKDVLTIENVEIVSTEMEHA